MEIDELEFLKKNLADLEEETNRVQSNLSTKRKRDLWIRQRLLEIEQEKDPGVYLFKPVCNWNMEEEETLKEELKNLIQTEEELKLKIRSMELQTDGLKKCYKKLSNKSLAENILKNEGNNNIPVQQLKSLSKKSDCEDRITLLHKQSLEWLFSEIDEEVADLKRRNTILYQNMEAAPQKLKKRDQFLNDIKQEEIKLNNVIELLQIYKRNENIYNTESMSGNVEIKDFVSVDEFIQEVNEYIIKNYGCITSDMSQMFHVKHLVKIKEVQKIKLDIVRLLFSIISQALNLRDINERPLAQVELAVSDKEIELLIEYYKVSSTKVGYDFNNRIKKLYESKTVKFRGEIITAIQKGDKQEEKNSLLVVLPLMLPPEST